MGNEACKVICEGVSDCGNVRILNLSKNLINDVGAKSIAEMIVNAPRIESLILHWN
jgi:hypothetical protein